MHKKSPQVIQQAFQLYRGSFTKVFQLTRQMRQQGQTETDLKFATALSPDSLFANRDWGVRSRDRNLSVCNTSHEVDLLIFSLDALS
jgi:hypothetical protein